MFEYPVVATAPLSPAADAHGCRFETCRRQFLRWLFLVFVLKYSQVAVLVTFKPDSTKNEKVLISIILLFIFLQCWYESCFFSNLKFSLCM